MYQHFKKHDWEVVYKNLVTLHYLIADKKAKNMNMAAGFT